jgi:YD repeat-containing protein
MISFRAMLDHLENPRRTGLPVKEIARYWSLRRILTWLAALATVATIYAVLPGARRAAIKPEDVQRATVAPRLDGTHPCVFASVSGGHLTTGLGQCATPVLNRQSVDRFEADLRYGAFVLRQSDLFLKDVFDVPLTRTYTSQEWDDRAHAFGRNSNHPYDIAPTGSRFPYTYITLMLEDGDFPYFKRISEGSGYSDAVFMHTESSTPFYKAIIFWNGDGWTLRLADGSEMHFPESYNAKNRAQGAPFELVDAAGNKLQLNRDRQRNLKEIRTPHGRWIRFEHDNQARIIKAEDDGGNFVQYGYNRAGLLTGVKSSSGAARHYVYDGSYMSDVLDERGRLLVHNLYQGRVLIGQEFANGDVYRYRYTWSPNGYYADTVVVTLPDKSEKVISPAETVPDYIRTYRK